MDFLPELLKQGIMGLVAGVFLWLFIQERAAHQKTRDQKDLLMEARRMDAKETLEKVEGPLSSIAQSTAFIADKLISVKRHGKA